MTLEHWDFSWDRGQATVMRTGAMAGPVSFTLDDGRSVQPFAVAPWSDDTGPAHEALPGVLKHLRGEWACVPFGLPEPPVDLPAAWLEGTTPLPAGEHPGIHGPSSNEPWQLIRLDPGAIELGLDYAADHPVRRVTRRLAGVAGRAILEYELSIETRAATELPIGLHPVFRLPRQAGGAVLSFDGATTASTYPVDVEAGVSRFRTGLLGLPLGAIPCKDGSSVDITRQPLPFATEEIVLISGHGGGATLTNSEEGYAVRLTWDAEAFPSCILWQSNTGRSAYPWNGRFQAIGIEPVAAPFDLGTRVARHAGSPLRRAGLATSRHFAANSRWRTRYAIQVRSLL